MLALLLYSIRHEAMVLLAPMNPYRKGLDAAESEVTKVSEYAAASLFYANA